MALIGLSGGIASGKSTVARLLTAKGATIVDADRIGHAVLVRGAPGYQPVLDRFGSGVLGEDGEIDRARLGAAVFADPQARRDLEAVSHPLIFAEMARVIQQAQREDPGGVVVVDAPLLVETGGAGRLGLQALVVVAADPGQQLARAVARGTSRERAEAVIAAQAPIERKLAAADYVLDNRGTPEELAAGVDTLWADLTARFSPAAG